MRRYLNKFRNGQEIDDQQFPYREIFDTLRDLQTTDKEITGLLRASRTIEWLGIQFITCWLGLEGLLMYEQMQHGRKSDRVPPLLFTLAIVLLQITKWQLC
jgi:hypothetical protein